MLGYVLLSTTQLLRRVHRQPKAVVAVRAELSFGGELRERRRLVVAQVGQPLDRLLREDVDAAADPVRDPAAFLEPGDHVVVVELDDAERRVRPGDRHRRGRARGSMVREERAEVDGDQLIAVHRVDVALLLPLPRGELDPAAATETFGLLRTDDL